MRVLGRIRLSKLTEESTSAARQREIIEEALESAFLEAVGEEPVLERVYQPAEDHQIELDEAVRAVDELAALAGTMTSETMRSRLSEQLRALDTRISHLEKLPTRPGGWSYRETGERFSDRWKASNETERRELLTKSGIRFKIRRVGGKALHSEIYTPEEVVDLLNAKKPP